MEPRPIKPVITSDLLARLDIRVGTIEEVEDIENSTSLMRLLVDFGNHRRTILAGIKNERANATEIRGQQALFVVNVAPKRMMGLVSEGMLLDIGYEDGIAPVLAVPEKPVPNGVGAG